MIVSSVWIIYRIFKKKQATGKEMEAKNAPEQPRAGQHS
jgi:hypothetical protein